MPIGCTKLGEKVLIEFSMAACRKGGSGFSKY